MYDNFNDSWKLIGIIFLTMVFFIILTIGSCAYESYKNYSTVTAEDMCKKKQYDFCEEVVTKNYRVNKE